MTHAPTRDADLDALVADDRAWPRPGGEPVQVPEVSPYWRHAPWGGSGRPWLDGTDTHAGLAPAADGTRPASPGLHDAVRAAGIPAGPGPGLVALGGAGSLVFALLAGHAWGSAATTAGSLDWGVLVSNDSHAWVFGLAWMLCSVLGACGWLMCRARRTSNPSAQWAVVAGWVLPVFSVLAALAMLVPTLDNLPG